MKYKITQLTPYNTGCFKESGDILPDMLNGSECPRSMADMLAWLSSEGFSPADGFQGWSKVVRHDESGEILSIQSR